MTAKTDTFETDLLELLTTNQAIANIGDASGLQPSSADGNFYIALFTADPGEGGSFTNEATYTGYARDPIARTTSEWTVASGLSDNDNAIVFAPCTAGSNSITHAAICKTLSGTGSDEMILKGALDAALAVSAGITPQFAAGDFNWSED